MILTVQKSPVGGRISIPGSKSHTIRALFIASLAEGVSVIRSPLISSDIDSAVNVCTALGAKIQKDEEGFKVHGFNRNPKVHDDVINVGNSGTTLRFAMMAAGLGSGCYVFTGDDQIRKRPLGPLIEAMNNLGAQVYSTRDNGMAPVVVRGKLKGGYTPVDSVTSQFLSSILITAPLIEHDTHVSVTRLNEIPYVEMTTWWLDKQNILYSNECFKTIRIKGGQKYKAFDITIPGDFSSATFFIVLAAISGQEYQLDNLDMTDPQGDKSVLSIVESMGAKIDVKDTTITVRGGRLTGREIDMNAIPDALPAMAVAGCFAEGETRLVNVPQARLKETDRISTICTELKKMGADIEELPDGLVIRKSVLRGGRVSGHGDHRIVMALAVAGLNAEGQTIIDSAQAIDVTFPEFVKLISLTGGNISVSN